MQMEDQYCNPYNFWKSQHRYEWDCIGVAIYYGKLEIATILEEGGIIKGKKGVHLEAAILSYRNSIAKEIINRIEDKNETSNQDILMDAMLVSEKNNNLNGFELLVNNGANFNIEIFIIQIMSRFF